MSNCTSGCPTQACESYAACLRAKGNRVSYSNSASGLDRTAQRRWDSELALYKDARAQGIQPSGTSRAQVERALAISDASGKAYQA